MINEIAIKLKEKSIPTAFPLELPQIENLVDVQEEILISIPTNFRDYLMHCSDVIYGHLEPVTIADPKSSTYLPEVTASAWDRGMPREYIALCPIDGGCYCVEQDDTVYLWREGSEEVEPCADDIWRWVRDIWLGSE